MANAQTLHLAALRTLIRTELNDKKIRVKAVGFSKVKTQFTVRGNEGHGAVTPEQAAKFEALATRLGWLDCNGRAITNQLGGGYSVRLSSTYATL